jgi:hypothetical protein
MNMFEMPETYKGPIDFDGGFLCFETYWRPQAGAPDPEAPGEKLRMSSYIPVAPAETCLCGSGKPFAACCRPKRLWYMVSPNPGIPGVAGYSLMKVQTATFPSVDGTSVRRALMSDIRLHCTEDTPERAFWIHEGDSAIQTPHGIMCFGDIELQHNHTLFVTAMSDVRMRALLSLLREDCGDLGRPRIKYEPIQVIDKRTGKSVVRQPEPPARGRRRKR